MSFNDVLCPGYQLLVPVSQPAVGSYPFAMHRAHSVPWRVTVISTDVFLHSSECAQQVSCRSGSAVTPCLPCRNLHNNSSVMGIRHCALNGAPEKTPYNFLAPSHAINSLHRKDEQIDNF